MLGGGDLVVLGLGQDAQLPQLLIQVSHEGGNSGLDHTKVVVIHFLTLGGLGTEQRPTGVDQVFALVVHLPVYQEVLLLRADGGADAGHVLVAEELQNPHSLPVEGLHGAKQGSLLIQSLAAVGAEGRGNAQGLALDEGVGGRIPCGVASGLEGRPQAAGGEAGRVRLAFNQLLAGKIHDHAAVGSRGDEAVVLLGGDAGQRLEPMGVVGGTVGDRPILHGGGHCIGHAGIQLCAVIDGLAQGLVDLRTQIGLHHPIVKHQTAEIIRNSTHNITPFLCRK